MSQERVFLSFLLSHVNKLDLEEVRQPILDIGEFLHQPWLHRTSPKLHTESSIYGLHFMGTEVLLGLQPQLSLQTDLLLCWRFTKRHVKISGARGKIDTVSFLATLVSPQDIHQLGRNTLLAIRGDISGDGVHDVVVAVGLGTFVDMSGPIESLKKCYHIT